MSVSPPPLKRLRNLYPPRNEPSEAKRQQQQQQQLPPSTPRHRIPVPAPSAAKLTVFSWNVNGVSAFFQSSILESFTTRKRQASSSEVKAKASSGPLREFLRRHQWPHVLNLQEVKINPTDKATQRRLLNAANRSAWSTHDVETSDDDGPPYVVHFCLPKDKYNATGFGRKVYGVASIIRQDYFDSHVENVREVSWDLEGRVLIIETKNGLAIINVYAVNGTDYPYRSSESGKVVGTRHDRKLQFHSLLVEECKSLQDAGKQVIVSGDLNVARQPIDGHPKLRTRPEQHARNRKDFDEKFFTNPHGFCAVDTFRTLHPEKRLYTWMSTNLPWMKSCDRVDYILISSSLEAKLDGAEIFMMPNERGRSDHFPISATFNII